MKSRILLLPLFLFLPFGFLTAQQNPDSTQDGCAFYNRLKKMSQSEFEELLAKAQAGDAAAQYQVGSAYLIGGPVRRNQDEVEKWLLKSFEQHYAPPEQGGVCVIRAPMTNGREHPELIPDSVAYRSWFNQVGHALDDEAKVPGQTKAVLDMTHLSDGDQAALKNIIRAWHQQQKQLVSTYNAEIEEANRVHDFRSYAIQVKFRHAQADLALGTAKIAKESLSPEGAKQFEQFIQAQKGAMSMNDGVI
jgi:TPR repeat protein